MSDTHPNALLMEAAEKRRQAASLIGEASQLETRAAQITGSAPETSQPETTETLPVTPTVVRQQPDGFPIHDTKETVPSHPDTELGNFAALPSEPQAQTSQAPANVSIPLATAPAAPAVTGEPKQQAPEDLLATANRAM
jgi:hypothetical protein